MCVDGKSVLRPGQANNTTEPDFGHFALPGQKGYVTPRRKAGVRDHHRSFRLTPGFTEVKAQETSQLVGGMGGMGMSLNKGEINVTLGS